MATPAYSTDFIYNTNTVICNNINPQCLGHKYLYNYDWNTGDSLTQYLELQVTTPSGSTTYRYYLKASPYVVLPDNYSEIKYVNSGGSGLSRSGRFRFYDENPIATTPSGRLDINSNGTYDVTNYASVKVDVPPIYGTYHDDYQDIYQGLLFVGGSILAVYFFYCLYRMLFKAIGKD